MVPEETPILGIWRYAPYLLRGRHGPSDLGAAAALRLLALTATRHDGRRGIRGAMLALTTTALVAGCRDGRDIGWLWMMSLPFGDLAA